MGSINVSNHTKGLLDAFDVAVIPCIILCYLTTRQSGEQIIVIHRTRRRCIESLVRLCAMTLLSFDLECKKNHHPPNYLKNYPNLLYQVKRTSNNYR